MDLKIPVKIVFIIFFLQSSMYSTRMLTNFMIEINVQWKNKKPLQFLMFLLNIKIGAGAVRASSLRFRFPPK
jgi:hypothetical protein